MTVAYLAGFAVLVAVNEGSRAVLSAAGQGQFTATACSMAIALTAYAGFLWLAHAGTRGNLRYARELADPRRFVAFLKGGP